jgi:hypothetical protein
MTDMTPRKPVDEGRERRLTVADICEMRIVKRFIDKGVSPPPLDPWFHAKPDSAFPPDRDCICEALATMALEMRENPAPSATVAEAHATPCIDCDQGWPLQWRDGVLVHLFDTKAEPCVRMKPSATVEEAAKRAVHRIRTEMTLEPSDEYWDGARYDKENAEAEAEAVAILLTEFARVPAPPAPKRRK